MKKWHPLLQISAVFLLIISIVVSFFSLILFLDKPTDFKIDYDSYFLPTIYILSTFLSWFILYKLIKSAQTYKFPKGMENKYILKLNYTKSDWLHFKRKEYISKIVSHYIKIWVLLIPIVIGLFFIYKEGKMVALALTNLVLVISLPLICITEQKFLKEIANNLYASEFEVKIYRSGIKINKWYFPYNHYIDSETNIKLTDIRIINENELEYLKFKRIKKFYYPDEYGNPRMTRTNSIKIPITKNISIDLKKLRNDLK